MTAVVPVARRNLLAEKGRLAMSVAGVAFALMLVLIIVSLYRGWGGASRLFADLPGDLWVAQEGTSDPFRSASHLPATGSDDLVSIPGVRAVMPVYARRIAVDAGDLDVFFMSLGVPDALPVAADVRKRFLPSPGHVIVDSVLAGEAGLKVGDAISVLDARLVVERVNPGGTPIFELAFLNAADARTLALDGYVNFFLLATAPGADLSGIAGLAARAIPGSEVRTSEMFAASMSKLVDQGFLPVVGVLVGIGLVIGGAVIALTIYTATIERARDFGVLKAVGASNGFVYRIVVQQSLLVGALGAAIGVAASAVAVNAIKGTVPEFVTDFRWVDAVELFAAAVGVSVLAAAVPARRINRIDPAMVFRA